MFNPAQEQMPQEHNTVCYMAAINLVRTAPVTERSSVSRSVTKVTWERGIDRMSIVTDDDFTGLAPAHVRAVCSQLIFRASPCIVNSLDVSFCLI